MTPVSAVLDSRDGCGSDANSVCYFTLAYTSVKEHPYCKSACLCKDSSAIIRSSMSPMFNSVINIFLLGSILKVISPIIVPVSIEVSDNVSRWPFSKKSFCYQNMNIGASLSCLKRSFFERDAKIRGCFIKLSNKPFVFLNRGNPTVGTNLVMPLVSLDWLPNFRKVCHA